jgi:16S rRNA processing protein RimM
MSAQPVRIGQIVGAHGLRGQVKVEPLTEVLERFDVGARLRLNGNWVTVETFTIHKNRPLIKLSGVNDVDAAKALQWEYLEAVVEDVELEEDEFLTEDLIGCRVVTTSGIDLGEVEEILELPAHDVLQVGEVMIPVVKEFIKNVDLEEEVILVELIPGMLPGEEPIVDRRE